MRCALLAAAAAVAALIWLTGQFLPPMVASHFAASGAANGFMPRGAYLGIMLCIGVAMPAAMTLLTMRGLTRPGARINVPNRDYWLAPERRGQTIAFVQWHMVLFGVMLMLFLAYAHFLVVRTNRSPALALDFQWLLGGLAVFLVAVAAMLVRLVAHFRLPAGPGRR